MTKALKAVMTTAQDLNTLARQYRAAITAYRAVPEAERSTALLDLTPLVEAATRIKARDADELAVKASMASGNGYSIADMLLVRSILADIKRLSRK